MTSPDFLNLHQKTLLVTGASSGIGRETALMASTFGARIALVARRTDALEGLAALLPGEGHIVVPYDLTDIDGIPEMVRSVADLVGGLDGLVHAAGCHSTLPLRSVSSSKIQELFDINVAAAIMLAKGFRHKQVRKPSASIVLLSSAVGLVGQPGVSVYSATKGAIITLTKSLALELAREDIRVNCVSPGVVMTSMTQGIRDRIGKEGFQAVTEAHPLGLGEPSDVANAILFLLSSSSRWITGTSVSVDGGYTAQ
ncbi:SDR family oxidoreductase [Cryobacterium sinapicolor]|uniref:SDR family oxidoreductase n=1 Tax=Cryobacterium sinapicolor TaxID=1259236 RepID=A0ABY2ITS7_9MICO|nr:SDR family oxidoreductase [Cryobacterium sinapicolor]TFC94714.1 SDR family oxidoreductase [Cryobacterium sinapicolor]